MTRRSVREWLEQNAPAWILTRREAIRRDEAGEPPMNYADVKQIQDYCAERDRQTEVKELQALYERETP